MRLFVAALLSLTAVAAASASELVVGRFSAGELAGWEDKKFKGKTSYRLVPEGGKTVLEGHAVKAASGLLKKVKADPRSYPLLRWSWKVAHPIRNEDVATKKGDDFAARVYVVFPGTFFWQTRAVNYVWASRMHQGESVKSPYTSNAAIIAVESGAAKAGQWVEEERNVFEDFRRVFGQDPPAIGAVAVMTDTDDTGEEATAWYGDISLHAAKAQGTATH